MAISQGRARPRTLDGATRARRKFLRHFPDGFQDETYLDWERDYKWAVHEEWQAALGRGELARLLKAGEHAEIAARALRIEQRSRHSMLFSFEKMALRDAVRSEEGARAFAEGLHRFLHGAGPMRARFEAWVDVLGALPRRQTRARSGAADDGSPLGRRVSTWPVVTVFGFIAQPGKHVFLKPNATRAAAKAYGYDFRYRSAPNWETYASLLDFALTVRRDVADLGPRDMIDLQSFLWVQGSDEYA